MSLILDGTNGLSDVDGSAATPAIRGTDANTGIFFPAADTIAFSEGGTEVARFDSSGNLGIGTSSPNSQLNVSAASNARIELTATSGGPYRHYLRTQGNDLQVMASSGVMQFYTGATDGLSSTERMRIDSSGNLLFNSGYGSVATAYGCRAWVNFNGTGTVAIRGSGNVTSITDNGTGLYQVNFTSALVDANFAVVITGGGSGASGSSYAVDAGSATTAKVNIRARAVSGGAAVDEDPFNVAVFR